MQVGFTLARFSVNFRLVTFLFILFNSEIPQIANNRASIKPLLACLHDQNKSDCFDHVSQLFISMQCIAYYIYALVVVQIVRYI